MKQTLSTFLFIFLLTTVVVAQKRTTIMGDAWNGVVESVNEPTREITIVNPDKKTDKFTGVLEDGYKVMLKDGTSRELHAPELKPGVRIRVFYKSKTQDMAGQRMKVNVINRLQFLGRDDYTQLRERLKLEPSIPVSVAESLKLPSKDPFKLYVAFEPQNLDAGLVKWVDQWNKEQAAKYGRVEIVNDLAQADAAIVVIWGTDDSFFNPAMQVYYQGDPRDVAFGTGYLISKDDSGLHVLWQDRIALDVKAPQLTAPLLGKHIEKRLKARSK